MNPHISLGDLGDKESHFSPEPKKNNKGSVSKAFVTLCTDFAREILPLWPDFSGAQTSKQNPLVLTPKDMIDLFRSLSIPVIPISQLRAKFRIPQSMVLNVNERPVIFIRNGEYDISATSYNLAYVYSQILTEEWRTKTVVNKYLPFVSGEFNHANRDVFQLEEEHHAFSINLLLKGKKIEHSVFNQLNTATEFTLKAMELGQNLEIDPGIILHYVANENIQSDLCHPALKSLTGERLNDLIEDLFLCYTNFSPSVMSNTVLSFLKI